MKKVACLALLALSALAADTGARHELFPRFSFPAGSGFAVVWTRPGEMGVRVRIEDALPNREYAIILRGRLAGLFVTNDQGAGVGGGSVAIDPAWDADGDGVINADVTLDPNEGAFFQLFSDVFTVTLR